jgi:phosphoribosylamine--glycine ligase
VSYKIGFAGTDGRTLLSAVVTSTATSENYQNDFQGVVIRGMPAMPPFAMSIPKRHMPLLLLTPLKTAPLIVLFRCLKIYCSMVC